MKKNEEFAGIDEKYIPEDEKNINESVSGSKEKMSNTTKAIIIGGICFGAIVLAILIFIVSIPFRIFNTSSKFINNALDISNNIVEHLDEEIDKNIDNMNKSDDIINDTNDTKNQILNEANKQKAESFNFDFEIYNGTQSKFFIESLLDKVVTNNKTEKEHIIKVKYNETVSNKPEDIVKIKHSLETGKMYEVLLDYDENGYVNQVNISDI